jgi:predicted O-methyltransferase YrrM
MGKSLRHLIRYLLGLEPAQSQTTSRERDALARHVSGRNVVGEIGVFEGLTSAVLARAMSPAGTLYCIDPFFPGRMGICWGKVIARRETARVGPRPKIIFVEKLSHEALQEVPPQLDFLFVDGDHSLPGITCDWTDWSERIRPDGIIALHDTRVPTHNPSVEQLGSHLYFESHIRYDERFLLLEQVDSLSLLKRKFA